MELSNEVKKQILESFIDNFTRIASKSYQRRIWVRGEGPEVDDFDDTANDYFVEWEPISENYKDFGITENQYQLLKIFEVKFEDFCDNNNWPHLFIDTPEWDEITTMAQEILNAFNCKKVRT